MSNSSNAVYVPTTLGSNAFRLKHKEDPIFYKEFDSESAQVIDVQNNIITIENHFFKSGEKLKYNVPDRGYPLLISESSPGNLLSTSILPSEVYPIVLDPNNIKLAFTKELALSGSAIDIVGFGTGNNHSFECEKQNTKCLITIDNIIQSPVSVGSTVEILGFPNSLSVILKSLKNIKVGTILKIGDELCKVISINYSDENFGQGRVSLLRGQTVLGTPPIKFTNSNTYATIMSGQYNIVKDKIYFVDSPFEGSRSTYKIELSEVSEVNFSFNLFNSKIKTGSILTLSSQNPPNGLIANRVYFAIKNYDNNFSFANSYQNAINGVKVEFDKDVGNYDPLSPVLPFDLTLIDFGFNGSSFYGRVFLRSNYDGNVVFDDLSNQFNGISSTFELKYSGLSTSGISSDNGVVLINNLFQYPEFEESFVFEENGSTTNLKFIGIGTTGDEYKDYDVNIKGFPRGGIIAGYGLSYGSNYQPQRGAILYETSKISIGQNSYRINDSNVGIAYSGSGYRYVPGYAVSVYFEQDGERISGFGTATITSGYITSIDIIEPCEYVGISTPVIKIDPPINYDNLPLSGSTAGIGARVTLNITDSGNIGEFKIVNPGYGYTSGEILSVNDLVGNINQTEGEKLKVLILSVDKDTFSAWNLGKLRKLDDLTPFVNGTRRNFSLTENGQLLSLESSPGSGVDIKQNVLVFFNDVLQIPGESYTFEGGSQIILSEPPPSGSTLKVYFYMGSDGDAILFDIDPKIKIGDTLKIKKKVEKNPQTQLSRTVKKILSSDTLKTEVYNKKGLSYNSFTYRSVDFTPQSMDKIIGGEIISKSRESLNSRIVEFDPVVSINGTFSVSNANSIGIATNNIQIGDFVESQFTDGYYTVTSVGIGSIGLSSSATNNVTGTYPVTIWRKSS